MTMSGCINNAFYIWLWSLQIFVQCFQKETFLFHFKRSEDKKANVNNNKMFSGKELKERISLPSQLNRACSHNGVGVCSHGGFLSSDTVGCTFKFVKISSLGMSNSNLFHCIRRQRDYWCPIVLQYLQTYNVELRK